MTGSRDTQVKETGDPESNEVRVMGEDAILDEDVVMDEEVSLEEEVEVSKTADSAAQLTENSVKRFGTA